MFFNNANCDIYIGKGAGKKLMEDIDNAKQSVKIVSPFLSPFLVKKLIDLNHSGVDVQLITTDTIEDFFGDRERNIHQLIQQKVHIDGEARRKKNRLEIICKAIYLFTAALVTGFLLLNYWLKNMKLLWLLIPIAFFFFAGRYFKSKAKNKKIYSYTYHQLFPFKVVSSISDNSFGSTFIYSKIYIIDDKVAYLGSLNFTGAGTKNNHETRIRLNDWESVSKIADEFAYLMYDAKIPEINIQEWGGHLYHEPEN